MRIRPIEQTTSTPSGGLQSRASAQDFGADVGGAVAGLGQNIENVTSVFDRLEDEKDRMWAATAASEKQLAWAQEFQARQTDPDFAKQYGPDGSKFAEMYQETMRKDAENTGLSAPSGRAQQYLQQQLLPIQTGLMQHAIAFQASTAGEYSKTQLLKTMDNDAKTAALFPNDAGKILSRGWENIQKLPYLTPEQKQTLTVEYEKNIAMAAGMGIVNREPEAVLGTLAPEQLSRFYPSQRVAQNPKIPVTAFLPVADKQAQVLAPYNAMTQQAATQYGVDPAFMQAQQLAESSGDPNAQSPVAPSTGKRSIGLAQFQPATAAAYNIDPTKPDQAIKGQAMYMSDLLTMFKGDYRKAAAAYNWGQGNVKNAIAKYGDNWLDNAPTETKNYLTKIFSMARPLPAATDTMAEQEMMKGDAPLREKNLPDWFNKLSWEQQATIVREAEQGVRANRVLEEQRLGNEEKQRDLLQKQQMNTMYDALLDGKLTAEDVRASGLDYGNKSYLINAISATATKEAKTDPAVFQDLFQKIHNNTLNDEKDLVQYLGKGLSFADTKILRDEVNGKRTREGGLESQLKDSFFANVKPSFIKTEFFQPVPPDQAYQYYTFQQNVLTYIEQEKKAGTSVVDLFDPTNKKYVGRLVEQSIGTGSETGMESNVKNLWETIKKTLPKEKPAQTRSVQTPSAKPALERLPGETPQEYNNRLGR